MNLSNLKFIKPEQVESLANTSTIVEVKETIVLCQNCHTNERSNTQSLLCHDCIAENKENRETAPFPRLNHRLMLLNSQNHYSIRKNYH